MATRWLRCWLAAALLALLVGAAAGAAARETLVRARRGVRAPCVRGVTRAVSAVLCVCVRVRVR